MELGQKWSPNQGRGDKRERGIFSFSVRVGDWGGKTDPPIREGIKMGNGKRGLGGFPLGERGKMSRIWNKATARDKTRHSTVLSTFGESRTCNWNICMNIGFSFDE